MIKISKRDKNQNESDTNKPILVFDFDGTIATHEKYPAIGKPIQKTINIIKKYKKQGYQIIISSCRFSEQLGNTKEARKQLNEVKKWLEKNEVPYDILWKHDKPVAKIYIDDKALNVKDLDKIEKMIEESNKHDKIMLSHKENNHAKQVQ